MDLEILQRRNIIKFIVKAQRVTEGYKGKDLVNI